MKGIRTSAPGKIVVCGEYAVLCGAPAVAIAVNRRATVSIRLATGDRNTVFAPGYTDTESQFVYANEHGFKWDGAASFTLLENIWNRFAIDQQQAFAVTLDTRGFRDPHSEAKYGLGSSAALAAALTAALARVSGQQVDEEELAMAAHREFQGGKGSGVDIAASCRGGVIAYSISGRRQQLVWPDGVEYAVLWSGRPASTEQRVERFAAAEQGADARALGEAAAAVLDSWPDRKRVFRVLHEYIRELQRFSAELGLGIFDAGHAELTEMADGDSVIYKPCGAGGGDIGIVLAQDPVTLRNFVERAVATGFRQLDVTIDASGLRDEGPETN